MDARHFGWRPAAALFLLCASLSGAVVGQAANASSASSAQSAAEFNSSGVAQYNAGAWRDAIACFQQAYELAPENPTVRRNLCNAYQAYAGELAKSALFAEAAAQLEFAIGVDPENASPLLQLGSYHLRLDQTAEAVFRLEEAAELDPENVDAHDLLGDAYYRDNDLPAALTQWEWVREVEPNRAGLQAKMEKAYREESVEYKYGRRESRHFRISFAPGSGGDLSEVLRLLEAAYRDIGRRFGGVFPPSPIQVIVYTADDFAQTTMLGEHVGALYDGKIRVPIKDKTGRAIESNELRRRLFHEYAHVVVRFLADANVPWWLNEGLAETFSSDLSSADAELLDKAYREGLLFHLSDLERVDLRSWTPDALRLAYTQSHATVRYLYGKLGQRPLSSLMSALAEGTPASEATQAAYRRSYEMIEKEVAMKGFGRVLTP